MKNGAGQRTRKKAAGRSEDDESAPNAMNPRQAATYLGVSVDSLKYWRMRAKGEGPPYFRPGAGKLVRYRKADLDEWIQSMIKK
jgi:predicted DNA-binding transcriptional regulator AlpA